MFAVLLTLGLYTFFEYDFRKMLAKLTDSCILASSCGSACSHESKWNSLGAVLFNNMWTIFGWITLAYLGVVFGTDSTKFVKPGFSLKSTLDLWKSLNFVVHWFLLYCFIASTLIYSVRKLVSHLLNKSRLKKQNY